MFLVARRALDGPHFGQSVVYLVAHGEDGTLGLIVNRSSDIKLSEAVPDIEDMHAETHELYYGGPVGLPMIVMLLRSDSGKEGMARVADDVYVSSERHILVEALAAKKPRSAVHFYLGYAGWAAGQLAAELVGGSWHVVAADTDAIFSSEVDSLWYRLIERLEPLGLQVNNRNSQVDVSSPYAPPESELKTALAPRAVWRKEKLIVMRRDESTGTHSHRNQPPEFYGRFQMRNPLSWG